MEDPAVMTRVAANAFSTVTGRRKEIWTKEIAPLSELSASVTVRRLLQATAAEFSSLRSVLQLNPLVWRKAIFIVCSVFQCLLNKYGAF